MSRLFGRNPLLVAALAAATGLGLPAADVVPRGSLGDWVANNNRPRGIGKSPKKKLVRRARLAPATGPGSINAESEIRELIESGDEEGAAKLYRAVFQVFYKVGSPQIRSRKLREWYRQYTAPAVLA